MKIVLSSRGSRGDVNPVIELASAFKQAGDEVSICVPGIFKDYSEELGLDISIYKDEDSKALMKSMGSGLGSLKAALDFFSNSVDEQFDFMLEATKDADALVTTINEVVAPTVAEYRKIPHFRLAFSPVLPGNHPPPFVPWQNMPVLINKLGWHGLSAFSKIILKKFVNDKRLSLGLEKVKKSDVYHTGNSHTILAINPQLSPPCKTWEKKYKYDYSGYCYGQIYGDLDQALLDFIDSGEPPVYIGFGSVELENPDTFSDMINKAVEKVGCRVIVGQGWTGLGNGNLNKDIFYVGDTHHGTLFPKMAGIIHHGGSGTTHTAARSGIPQFIMPQIYDQYFWGNQIYKNGLGPRAVSPNKISFEKLVKGIEELKNGKYRNAAQKLAHSMKDENGVGEIVEIVKRNLSSA